MRLFSGFQFLALEKAGSPHVGSGQEFSEVLNSPVSLPGVPRFLSSWGPQPRCKQMDSAQPQPTLSMPSPNAEVVLIVPSLSPLPGTSNSSQASPQRLPRFRRGPHTQNSSEGRKSDLRVVSICNGVFGHETE